MCHKQSTAERSVFTVQGPKHSPKELGCYHKWGRTALQPLQFHLPKVSEPSTPSALQYSESLPSLPQTMEHPSHRETKPFSCKTSFPESPCCYPPDSSTSMADGWSFPPAFWLPQVTSSSNYVTQPVIPLSHLHTSYLHGITGLYRDVPFRSQVLPFLTSSGL